MSKVTIHTETLPSGFTFQMHLIPGGVFDMGGRVDPEARENEKPKRVGVQVDPFYLAPQTVTQGFWKAVMGATKNPSSFKGDQRPVESITWHDAQGFIKTLNALTEANRQHLGQGKYRLPTEAEWEYAARISSTATKVGEKSAPVRYRYAGSDKLKEVGWYRDNSDGGTCKVGLLLPNQLGLYDMSGNVWEWCEDWYGPYPSINHPNPVGPLSGSSRIIRGGSWNDYPQPCRVAYRSRNSPNNRSDDLGFRLDKTQ